MRGRILGIGMALAVGVGAGACSAYSNEGPIKRHQTERDARAADVRVSERDAAPDGADAGGDADAGSLCCPISPEPACCMEYGGSRLLRGSCGMFCDGMPGPTAPWRIGLDEHGCPRWFEPEVSTGCCGCIEPDAGD